jgi:HSP20 family molecular chaperone IbpA
MSVPARRQPLLPDLSDWFESFPSLMGWRPMASLQANRVEDFVDGDDYVVRAELPGIDPDNDVEITVRGGVLTIRAERKEEKSEKNRSEFRYGSFVRSVRLPEGAKEDSVHAAYKDGILTVRVTLSQPSTEAKKITISHDE